jgi:hypothetical protein
MSIQFSGGFQLTGGFTITTENADSNYNSTVVMLNGETASKLHTADASGNNLALTQVGAVATSKFNPFLGTGNYGLSIGASDTLVTPNNADAFTFGTGDFSFEVWIFSSVFSTASYSAPLWTNYVSGGAGLSLYLEVHAGQLRLLDFNGSGSTFVIIGGTIRDNSWHHLVMTRQSGTIRGFINGVLVTSATGITTNYTGVFLASIGPGLAGNYFNARIIRGGVPSQYSTSTLTTNAVVFTPPTVPFTGSESLTTSTASVVFLAAQDASFIDQSPRSAPLTPSSTVKVVTNTPLASQFTRTFSNYGSTWFNGSTSYIQSPIGSYADFGSGAFTIETWIFPTVPTTQQVIAFHGWSGSGAFNYGWNAQINTSNQLAFYANGTLTAFTDLVVTMNAWNHIAFVGIGGVLTAFKNGVKSATTYTYTAIVARPTATTVIGGWNNNTENIAERLFYNGAISNFHIVNGTALYTSSFTVSTTPISAIGTSVLLTCQNATGTITDASTVSNALTVVGGTRIISATPFTTTYTSADRSDASTFYGSGYFSGSPNYISIPASAALVLPADFTIECWVNASTLSGNQGIIASSGQRFGLIRLTNYFYWLGSTDLSGSSITISANTWYHLAASRVGTTLRLFVNGVQANSGTYSEASTSNIWYIGNDQSNEIFNGYISNIRVVKGTGLYTTNFVPPTTQLPTVSGTSLLTLQGRTTSTNVISIYDESANSLAVTAYGSPTQGSFSPFNQGGYSYYFNGAGDYLTIPASTNNALGSDFTIEVWVYTTIANQTYGSGIAGTYDGGSNGGWSLIINRSTGGPIGIGFIHANAIQQSYTTAYLAINTWHHIAITRSGTTLKTYLNGTQVATGTYATADTVSAINYIGSQGVGSYHNGYISNLRVIKGTAIYTANFAPSYTPLTAVDNTVLLTAQANSFSDASTLTNTITRVGAASVRPFTPFPQFRAYNAFVDGSSIYMNGTSDYIATPANAAMTFGNNDHTVEFWYYLPNTAHAAGYSTQWKYSSGSTQQGTNDYYFQTGTAGGGSGGLALGTGGGWALSAISISATQFNALAGQWTHIAWTRASNVFRLFFNGVLMGSATYTGSIAAQGGAMLLGQDSSNNYGGGYYSGYRVINGYALYTGGFTPPTSPLTAVPYTQLLTANTATFVDSSYNNFSITRTGTTSTRFSPNTPTVLSNGNSVYFDGSTSAITLPTAFASTIAGLAGSITTMEAFIFPTNTTSRDETIIGGIPAVGTNGRWSFVITTGATTFTIKFIWTTDTSTAVSVATTVVTGRTNTWNHVAVVIDASIAATTNVTLFINGTAQGFPYQVFTSQTFTYDYVKIGFDTGYTNRFTGYMSNLRVIKGTIPYIYKITPPVINLNTSTFTRLLTAQTVNMNDTSVNSLVATRGGTTMPQRFSPFGNTTADLGYSGYFNGTTDYVQVPAGPAFAPGTADFTVEGWFYPTNTMATQGAIWTQSISGTNYFVIFATNNVIQFYGTLSGGGTAISSGSNNWSVNSWNHFAVVRTSGSVKVYLNGIAGTATADINNYSNISYVPTIGRYTHVATNFFYGYISNLRYLNRIALYTGNFTVPASPLAVTQSSSTNIAALTTIPTNGSSVFFNGSTDYLTAPSNPAFQFGTGAFTMEAWINPTVTAPTVTQWIISNIDSASGNTQCGLSILATSNKLQFQTWNAAILTSTAAISLNVWTHVAISFDGTTYKLFINGVLDTSGITLYNFSSAGTAKIGYALSGNSYFTGLMSNARIVKGTAVYTTAFTPSTSPLTAITNTSLLTCQSTTIIDNSINNYTITSFGTPSAIKTLSPFGNTPQLLTFQSTTFVDNSTNAFTLTTGGTAGPASLSPFVDSTNITSTAYSVYFNGTTDNLTLPVSTATTQLGSSDFTIEGWMFFTEVTNDHTLVYWNGASSGYAAVHVRQIAGKWALWISATGSAWAVQQNTLGSTITSNTWYHVAVVRSGTNFKLYINGSDVTSGGYTVSGSLMTTYTTNNIGLYNSSNYYMSGYISNFRMVISTALYTASFAPTNTPLSAITNTALLTCQSSTIKDNSANAATITTVGSAAVSAYNPFNTRYSFAFNGTSDYIEYAHNTNQWIPASTSFAVECWFMMTKTGAEQVIFTKGYQGSPTYAEFAMIVTSGNMLTFLMSADGGNWIVNIADTVAIAVNTWYHVAGVRTGENIVKLYKNGVSVGTPVLTSVAMYNHTAGIRLGAHMSSSYLQGFISNARFTVGGDAIYSTNFIPTTSPLTTSTGNTLLLACQSSTLVDNSVNNFALTAVGSPTVKVTNPFTTNYSYYFNGTSSDYLTIPASGALDFGTSNFTIEIWAYPTASGANRRFYSNWGSSGSVQIGFRQESNNTLRFFTTTSGIDFSSSTLLTLNAWNHCAIVRNGSVFTMFLNGIIVGTVTSSSAMPSTASIPTYISTYDGTNEPWSGFLADLRVVKGVAVYTGGFTPIAPPLPISNTTATSTATTSLIVLGNNGSIVDQTGKSNVIVVGATAVDPSVYKFGSGSIKFNGTTDYLNIVNTGTVVTGNFTVEAWIYPTSVTGSTRTFWTLGTEVANRYTTGIVSTSSIYTNLYGAGSVNYANTTIVANTWTHVAMVRSGSTIKWYINGVASATTDTQSGTLGNNSTLKIGADSGGAALFVGYMDDFRFSLIARYTSNFIPPTASLPTYMPFV